MASQPAMSWKTSLQSAVYIKLSIVSLFSLELQHYLQKTESLNSGKIVMNFCLLWQTKPRSRVFDVLTMF